MRHRAVPKAGLFNEAHCFASVVLFDDQVHLGRVGQLAGGAHGHHSAVFSDVGGHDADLVVGGGGTADGLECVFDGLDGEAVVRDGSVGLGLGDDAQGDQGGEGASGLDGVATGGCHVKSPDEKDTVGSLLVRGAGEYPFGEQLEFVVLQIGLRRHRHGTVDARTTRLDAGGHLGHRIGLPFVLGGHVLVGRADQLLVHRVAGHAVLALGQGFVGESGSGQRGHGGHNQESAFHGVSL